MIIAMLNFKLEYDIFSSGVPGYVWDYYEPSLKMSTYLVAMVIADFSYAESTIDSNVTLRVWARHSAINQTKYVLELKETFFK